MKRRAWAAVAAAVGWSGLAPGQSPAPLPAPPVAGPSEIKEGQELTVRTAGQPDRRVRVARVSVYPDGESLADVQDLATGARYTIPAKALSAPMPAAQPASAVAESREGDVVVIRTAGQPDRRVKITRVSDVAGEPVADVEDLATGSRYTIPAKVLAGMLRSGRAESQPRTTAPQPVRTAPPAAGTGWPRSGSPAALAAGSRTGFRTNLPVPAPPAGSHTPFTPPDRKADRTAVPPPSAIKGMTQPTAPSPSPSYAPTPPPTVTPPSYARPPAPTTPPVPTVTPPPIVKPVASTPVAPSAPVMPTVVVPPPARTTYSVPGTQYTTPPAPVPPSLPDPAPAGRTQPVVAEFRVPNRMDEELRPHLSDLTSALRPTVRERAASALAGGRYGWRPEVKAELAKAAESDPAPTVRAHCIRLLSDLGYHDPRYVDFLDAAAASGPPAVKQAAQAALAKLTPRR